MSLLGIGQGSNKVSLYFPCTPELKPAPGKISQLSAGCLQCMARRAHTGRRRVLRTDGGDGKGGVRGGAPAGCGAEPREENFGIFSSKFNGFEVK